MEEKHVRGGARAVATEARLGLDSVLSSGGGAEARRRRTWKRLMFTTLSSGTHVSVQSAVHSSSSPAGVSPNFFEMRCTAANGEGNGAILILETQRTTALHCTVTVMQAECPARNQCARTRTYRRRTCSAPCRWSSAYEANTQANQVKCSFCTVCKLYSTVQYSMYCMYSMVLRNSLRKSAVVRTCSTLILDEF